MKHLRTAVLLLPGRADPLPSCWLRKGRKKRSGKWFLGWTQWDTATATGDAPKCHLPFGRQNSFPSLINKPSKQVEQGKLEQQLRKCQRIVLIKTCRRREGDGKVFTWATALLQAPLAERPTTPPPSSHRDEAFAMHYLCTFCHQNQGDSRCRKSSAAPQSCARSGESSHRCCPGSYRQFPFQCLAEK